MFWPRDHRGPFARWRGWESPRWAVTPLSCPHPLTLNFRNAGMCNPSEKRPVSSFLLTWAICGLGTRALTAL